MFVEAQRLKAHVAKSSLIASTRGTSESLGSVQGVMEIDRHELRVGAQIAQGKACLVNKASWRSAPVAVKKVLTGALTEEKREEVKNEVRMLARVRHPNVVLLMGVCTKP